MKNLGYYNGKFGEIEEMSIPMNDRVCFFGDGVYDATYSRNYRIFTLDEHIDRFYNSASLLGMNITETKEELKAILNEMVGKMDTGENFVYWQVTRGTAIRNHVFPENANQSLDYNFSQGYRGHLQKSQAHNNGGHSLFPLQHKNSEPYSLCNRL